MTPLLVTANIAGYIGFVLLFIQTVLGSRHIFKYFTKDTVLVHKIHKFLGIYGIFAISLHPLLEMMVRLESLVWLFVPIFEVPSAAFVTLGKFGFILFLVIWITSALVREKIAWKPWKYVHLLAYPAVILIGVHMTYIGTFFQDHAWIRAVWFFMMTTVVVSIVVRLLAYASYLKKRATISAKEVINDTICVLTLTLSTKLDSAPAIGQHMYMQASRFASEHPFTVMGYDDATGAITFGIRKVGGFWEELMAKNVGEAMYLDGPYGVFTLEGQNTEPKVIISGGIGVTPFVRLVEAYGTNATYINCNRNEKEIIRRDVLKKSVTTYVDILDEGQASDDVRIGRISEEVIIAIVGDSLKSKRYFVCGSPMFIRIVRGMLTNLGVKSEDVYYEALGF